MTEALHRDTTAPAEHAGDKATPSRPGHTPPPGVPPLWLMLLARWAAGEVRIPRAAARD